MMRSARSQRRAFRGGGLPSVRRGFSLSERVVYDDFEIGQADDVPLHLYVMPAGSLITDAKARNRVFEEVLRFNVEKKTS